MRAAILQVLALAAVAACEPTNVPVATAEAQCARNVMASGPATPTVSIGIGTGSGNWNPNRRGVSTGVAVATTIPVGGAATASLSDQYDACVLRRSGQLPVTPLAQRPEVRG